jgi:hypothetical protein
MPSPRSVHCHVGAPLRKDAEVNQIVFRADPSVLLQPEDSPETARWNAMLLLDTCRRL